MMISRQNYCHFAILMFVLAGLLARPSQAQAQSQYYGYAAGTSSPAVGTTAPGLLQPAYMQSQPIQVAPPASRYENAEQMVNSRVPRGNDLSLTNQHTLLQYRRLYRSGTTPSPSELKGQWNGVNKGIVEVAGYGQFIKDIRVDANGQLYGDNVQVGQVKPSQVRLNGWEPKFDHSTTDYERRGRFAVQAPTGRGVFGRGATFSYADGNNPDGDPARLLKDQVVKLNDHQMLGRAVVQFGPIEIPLSYFVLERRQ